MSDNCGKVVAFGGRSSFNSLMAQVIGVSLIKNGTSSFVAATFIAPDTWKTLIAGVAGMNALPLSIKRGFENTTPEVSMEESNLGFKEQTTLPIPSLKGYLDGSYCDYRVLNKLNGQEFEVVLHLKDGSQFGTKGSGTEVEGFKATCHFYFGIPLAENRMQSYPIWVNFESYDEFENGYLATPNYTLRNLLNFIPVGMNFETIVALSSSTATVSVTKRGDGSPVEGLVAADFSVLSSNAPDCSVLSLVETGGGVYVLTIQRLASSVPAALASGEFAIVQATQDDATYYTYSSNLVTFTQS